VRVSNEIYKAATDGLWVSISRESDPDGGVERRNCRWGTRGEIMPCYLYDMTKAKGTAHTGNVEGNREGDGGNTPTPLAAAFVSFTDPADGTKYAVFSADVTGYDATLIRGVPRNTVSRKSTLGDGNGWFIQEVRGRALAMEICQSADDSPNTLECTWEIQ
jgi:hypothetical protein